METELNAFAPARGALITVGVFDGVHVGHAALIKRLVEQARARNLLSVVVTFKQHPATLFAPEQQPFILIDLAQRVRLLRELGVDAVVPLTFSRELAGLEARAFLLLLRKCLHMEGLVPGWNSIMGRDRKTPAGLRALGGELAGSAGHAWSLRDQLGFVFEEVGPEKCAGEVVSSDTIRQALAEGDMAKVAAMLGRPFSLESTVIKGDQRGRELGYPTANLSLDLLRALPVDGVYAALAHFEGVTKPAAGFIGKRVTFGGTRRVVEVYVLDFAGDLYGKTFKVELLERLRGEQKFSGIEALKAQMGKDVARIREGWGARK